MTHARSPHPRSSGRHAAPLAPPLPRSAAALAAPVPRPDPDSLADLRFLADALDCPTDCAHDSCRRAGRCRGPRETTATFFEGLPACLAETFDDLYAPVARWAELLDMIEAAGAKLATPPPDRDMTGRGRPPPNRSTR